MKTLLRHLPKVLPWTQKKIAHLFTMLSFIAISLLFSAEGIRAHTFARSDYYTFQGSISDVQEKPQGIVRGTVQHALTQRNIPAVRIVLENFTTSTVITIQSNDKGEFTITDIPAGKYVLVCTAPGFDRYSTPIEITSADGLKINVKMIPIEIELSDLLNIIVVTATKSEKKPDDIPSMVDVVTSQQIEQRGYRHLSDVLNDILNNHQDRGNWGIGEPVNQNVGFGLRFDTGQNILLLFNGQRMNAFLPGNRFGGEEYIMDNIERIEIVRGPGSALYGANAFTLVVNVITKHQVGSEDKGYLRVRPMTLLSPSSNAMGYGGNVSFASAIDKSTFFTGTIQGITDPGQNIEVKNALFGNAILQDRIGHAMTGNVVLRHEGLQIFAQFTNQSRSTMTGFNSISPTDGKGISEHLSLSMYSYLVGANYQWQVGENTTLKFSAGWHQDNWTEVALIPIFKTNSEGSRLIYDGQGFSIPDTISVRRGGKTVRTSFPIDGQGGDSRTLEGEVQFTWNFTPTNSFIAGVNAIEDKVISAVRPTEIQLSPSLQFIEFTRLTDDANNWLFDTRASRLTLGFYAQADYDITPELTVNAGARVDVYSGTGILSEQRYAEFNPRGGIVYKHQEAGVFKVAYGRAMRVPNGFEALSSVTILGNPSLRPERIEMAQFAWIKNWNANIRTEFGGFVASVSNRLITDAAIDEKLKAQGYIGQFINVPSTVRQRTSGVDGKMIVRVGTLDAVLNATQYIATDDGYGRAMPYIPMTMLNANLNMPLEWLNINLGANYRSTFSRPADDTRIAAPAYLLATLTLTGKPFSFPLEIQAGVRNLLNSIVYAPSSSRDFVEHFRGRQREFWFSLSYQF
ncbi:MAG: TonB-dependent receptor [Candidatus Kapabacteria bacterium]|nr:TonB-dependent receptor [Candidatus Kapabacteria bacterium]